MQGVFFYSGNIGTADMKVTGNFPLRLLWISKKPKTSAHDLIFFFHQNRFHGIKNQLDIFTSGIVLHNIYGRPFYHIQKTDLISFFVRSNGFIKRNFPGIFFSGTEHHQKLIGNPVVMAPF